MVVYMHQMEALRASEQITSVNGMNFAFGGMNKADAEHYRRQLDELAAGSKAEKRRRAEVVRPTSVEQLLRLAGPKTKGVRG